VETAANYGGRLDPAPRTTSRGGVLTEDLMLGDPPPANALLGIRRAHEHTSVQGCSRRMRGRGRGRRMRIRRTKMSKEETTGTRQGLDDAESNWEAKCGNDSCSACR
jgi:hypothetical protein